MAPEAGIEPASPERVLDPELFQGVGDALQALDLGLQLGARNGREWGRIVVQSVVQRRGDRAGCRTGSTVSFSIC